MKLTEFAKSLRCPDAHWEEPHRMRYNMTAEAMCKVLPLDTSKLYFLDTGGTNPFSNAMVQCGERVEVTGNLELKERLPYADDTFDVVMSFEVLEHISDLPTTRRDEFTSSGQIHYCAEMRRVCKPGGWLFLTTPNSNGWTAIWRILHGQPPRFYDPHVRELNQNELGHIVTEAGWHVEMCYGLDCWPQMPHQKDGAWKRTIRTFCTQRIFEDDLFLVGRKS